MWTTEYHKATLFFHNCWYKNKCSSFVSKLNNFLHFPIHRQKLVWFFILIKKNEFSHDALCTACKLYMLSASYPKFINSPIKIHVFSICMRTAMNWYSFCSDRILCNWWDWLTANLQLRGPSRLQVVWYCTVHTESRMYVQ